MQKKLFFLALIVLIGISTNYSYSQEVRLATFQETAQIIVDKSISQNVTASITLQSTSSTLVVVIFYILLDKTSQQQLQLL